MRYLLALLLVLIFASSSAYATKIVIHRDFGGKVEERINQIASLTASNTTIEIRGTCLSACTLYIGMKNTCVYKNANLGFHGPRTPLPGIPLPRDDFEYWSQKMATYYPPEIRSWFLSTARYTTVELIMLKGSEVIKMGAKACK